MSPFVIFDGVYLHFYSHGPAVDLTARVGKTEGQSLVAVLDWIFFDGFHFLASFVFTFEHKYLQLLLKKM